MPIMIIFNQLFTKAEAQGFCCSNPKLSGFALDEEVLELATYYSANTELSVEEKNNAAALKEYGHLKFLGTKRFDYNLSRNRPLG